MKKTLACIGGFLLPFGVIYLIGCFIVLDWSISCWDNAGRAVAAIISIICGIFGASIASDICGKPIKHLK